MNPEVAAYFDTLPEDRRADLRMVYDAIVAGMPSGYAECIQYGMIGWALPHSLYPAGYHCDPKQPLPFVGLAAQKQHIGIYLFCVYIDAGLSRWFEEAWLATGAKLDRGKGCVRLKKAEGAPLDLVTEAVRRMPPEDFVPRYEAGLPDSVKKKRGIV